MTIKVGHVSISLQKDGTVTIKGKDIMIEAAGDATFKASKNLILRGQTIL